MQSTLSQTPQTRPGGQYRWVVLFVAWLSFLLSFVDRLTWASVAVLALSLGACGGGGEEQGPPGHGRGGAGHRPAVGRPRESPHRCGCGVVVPRAAMALASLSRAILARLLQRLQPDICCVRTG